MTVLLTTVFIVATGLLTWSLLKDMFKTSKIEQLSILARHDDKGEPVDEQELKIAMLLQIATELYDRDYIDIEIKRSGETGWMIESDVLLPNITFTQIKRATDK